MKTGIIYAYTHKATGRMYVGQTINPERRHRDHMRGKIGHSWKFNNAVRKYGPESFSYEILLADIPVEELNDWERFFIWHLRSYIYGFNLTIGGDFDRDMHSEPWFKERKGAAISRAWNAPGYREKMRAKLVQASARPEVKAKKSASQSATMAKTDVKEKHRESTTKAQRMFDQRLIRSRPIVCVETGEWFISYQAAKNAHGVDTGSLTRVLQGKKKTTGGYHWRHATEDETRIRKEEHHAQVLENI